MEKRKVIGKIFGIAIICLIIGSMLSSLVCIVEASPAAPKMDRGLAEMIDMYALEYYQDFWTISLSQYKAWIALITLQEAGSLRYHAHSSSLGIDKFYHKEKGKEFPFCTGIGAFQLDRGGSQSGPQGNAKEKWGTMPTIKKIDPKESLLSVLRWHRDRFGDPLGGKGVTLATFSENSAWVAVQPKNEPEFAPTWEAITGYTWDEYKDKYVDFEFNPSKPEFTIEDSFGNTVEYIGKAYWYIEGWDDYFDTWLISAKTYQNGGIYSYSYYYAYREDTGWEEWVWNDPDEKFIYRHSRHYTAGYLPENLEGNYAGFTDDTTALALLKNERKMVLKAGWNMISQPFKEFTIETDGEILKIYGYNPKDISYYEVSSLDDTIGGYGYWVYVDSDCEVIFSGTPVTEIELKPGWNMIGTINNEELPLSFVKKKCEVLGSVYTYNPSARIYDVVDKLEPGKGYWIYVKSSCLLALSN